MHSIYAGALAVLMFLAFAGAGGAILSWAGFRQPLISSLRVLPVAGALGLAVYSYLGWILVGLHYLVPYVLLPLFCVGIWVGRTYFRVVFAEVRINLPPMLRAMLRPPAIVFGVVAASFLILVAINSLTPPKEGDALQGYMFTARWLFSNGLAYNPYIPRNTLMPFNSEVIFAFSYAFGTDLVAKALDGIAGLMIVLLVYELASRFCSVWASVFAAASLAVMPAYATTWSSGRVDILASYTFLAAVSLLIAGGAEPRAVLAASFLTGTSCAQKYTSWAYAPGILVGIAYLAGRQPWQRTAKLLTLAAAVMFLCLTPHFAKALLWTGNPLAPFATSYFGSHNIYLAPPSEAVKTSFRDFLVFPVTFFYNRGFGRVPGPFPVLLLIGLPAVWFVVPAPKMKALRIIAASLLALWLVSAGQDWFIPRYMLIPVAIWLVVAAHALDSLLAKSRSLRQASWMTMLFLTFLLGAWYNRHWRESLRFVLGRESRQSWQDRIAPARGYSALQAIAPQLDGANRLLIYSSLYYLPFEKLQYVSTEREVAEFQSLPDGEKVAFLKRNRFKYVYNQNRGLGWAEGLPVVSRFEMPGITYTLLALN